MPQLPRRSVPELRGAWISYVQELSRWILPGFDQVLHVRSLWSRNILHRRVRQLHNVPCGNLPAVHCPHILLLMPCGSLPVQQQLQDLLSVPGWPVRFG